MNSEESDPHDHLIDMLLCELVGKETPPDMRGRVLKAVENLPRTAPVGRKVSRMPKRVRPVQPSKAPALLAAAAVFALLLAAGGLFYVKYASAIRTPVLTEISGTVNRSVGPISAGETISTDPDSSAVITYQDGTVVELASETTMVVPERPPWDRSKELKIVSGAITAEVARQPKGSPMTFASEDARAEVVGTKLSFRCDDGMSRLEVTEGAVRFVPRSGGAAVLVKSGLFAESGNSGFRSGLISTPPVRGITRFTLMNAETDQPIREKGVEDGETISLASLPTRQINLRADFGGVPPTSVKLNVTRSDGEATGLPPYVARAQKYPPFFVAGDHWADGRPHDCRAWTPRPGLYHISATAVYDEAGKRDRKEVKIDFWITD